jgi:hypothetical protein
MKKIPSSIFWLIVAVAVVVAVFIANHQIKANNQKAKDDFELANRTWTGSVEPQVTYVSPEVELAERIKVGAPITDRNVKIAKDFTYTTKPADFIEYCDKGLGFCFSYPKRWGTFTVKRDNVICEQEAYVDVLGEFSNAQVSADVAFVTTTQKEKCEVLGNDFGISDPFRSLSDADQILQVGNTNEEVGLWLKGESTMFFYYASYMALTAPTSDPLYGRMNFIFRDMQAPETAKQDIEDFVAMAHTFRLP